MGILLPLGSCPTKRGQGMLITPTFPQTFSVSPSFLSRGTPPLGNLSWEVIFPPPFSFCAHLANKLLCLQPVPGLLFLY